MNSLAVIFLVINGILLLALPRHKAPLPLLIGTCYMTIGQQIQIGPFHFPIIRILIAIGFLRITFRGERLVGPMNSLDQLTLIWACWALLSSVFHKDPAAALVYRLGFVYNAFGIYFLIRIFCQSFEDVLYLCRLTALLLVPISLEMLFERITAHNIFAVFGGVSVTPDLRAGQIRAQGPFAHAILAGTVGAANLPMMIGLWNYNRVHAITGAIASLVMVFTCASSGPILSALVAVAVLFMWGLRHHLRIGLWLAGFVSIVLTLIMKAPPYYLLARIDLTGGSTGWYRARLIESAVEHLSEWWLGGTDYTSHWMPTGAPWSMDQADITNHYIRLGVIGGIPLMLLFIAIIFNAFSFLNQLLRYHYDLGNNTSFFLWSIGASLACHAISLVAVSYYDQSFLFLYLLLAIIGSLKLATDISFSIEPVAT